LRVHPQVGVGVVVCGRWRSGRVTRFECMFDGSLPDVVDLVSLGDAALVDAAGELARAENAACARKLAVMAEIFARRTGLGAGDRELWWVDPQAAVAAEMAAAVNVSQGMALHQTHRGVALRDRLPKVAAVFDAGLVSDLVVRAIVWRTYLIDDAEAMAAVDAALAARITGWGALSAARTETEIDALVDEHDPGALRRARASAASLTVEFGSPSDVAGTTSMWARLHSPDGALIKQTIDDMVHSVCGEDPRTLPERRVAALKALAQRTELACLCGHDDCPGGKVEALPAKNAVVYVVADQTSVDAASADTPTTEPLTDPTGGPDDPADPCAIANTRRGTETTDCGRFGQLRRTTGLCVRCWDPAHGAAGGDPGPREDPRGAPPRRLISGRAALPPVAVAG
jgi:Domain of unknown function (DUF222)